MLTDPNQRTTTVKNQDITKISVACRKNSKNKLTILKILLETKTVTPKTLTQTTMWTVITTTTTKTVPELKGCPKLFIHAVRHVSKKTTPQRDVMFETMQQKGLFPGRANRKDWVDIINKTHRTVLLIVSGLQPNILTRNATSLPRNCEWQNGDHQKKIPAIPVVVCQQPLEIFLESSS